jgi:hypothetical protein
MKPQNQNLEIIRKILLQLAKMESQDVVTVNDLADALGAMDVRIAYKLLIAILKDLNIDLSGRTARGFVILLRAGQLSALAAEYGVDTSKKE